MKKILFLTSRLPFPPVGGDRLRTFNILKYLNQTYKVTLVSFVENKADLKRIQFYNKYVNDIHIIVLPKWVSYLKAFVGVFSKKPLQYHYYKSKKMENTVNSVFKKNNFDIVIAHLIRMAQYIPEAEVKKVIDFTDAISLNYERSNIYDFGLKKLLGMIEKKRVKNYEIESIEKTHHAIFISDVDASYLRTKENRKKIHIIKNGVDFKEFGFSPNTYINNKICFLGNMRTGPNVDAVLYFLKNILPKIIDQIPSVSFYIVGTEPPRIVKQFHDGKNVIVTGFVDDVKQYLHECSLLVAPMRGGAGVQNKILEAMAVGIAVITTSVGAEGLNNKYFYIADNDKEFAKKTIFLLQNQEERKRLVYQARKYVENEFEWNQVLSKFDTIL